MMDILAAVNARTITLYRFSASSRVAFQPVRSAPSTSAIVASVQQPRPDDLRMMGGLYDARDVAVITADDPLTLGSRVTGQQPDEVEIDDGGDRYRLMQLQVSDSLGPIPTSYRAIVVRVQALEAGQDA